MPRKTEEFFQVKVTKETWKLNTTSIPRSDPQFIKDIICPNSAGTLRSESDQRQ